jgi:hypothetical protein
MGFLQSAVFREFNGAAKHSFSIVTSRTANDRNPEKIQVNALTKRL